MPDASIWVRDLDGTGSMHPCAKSDPGAVEFIRADLVKPLTNTLEAIDAMNPHDHGKQGLWTAQKIVRAALQAYDDAILRARQAMQVEARCD
ncbi:hypothetical protein [Afipia carboxidovorans]|uniref:hypothetical protein n=1 Tax=Afipia carboxidovorans TaxID=40137 RepID=UPI0030879640|nr:hypothetical protein CRBSH125_34920 [Afipia carboxidovorans]